MKLGIAVATVIYLLGLQGAYAQEANDLAPPPPPEVEEEEAEATPAQQAPKKKKLDHCGPASAKVCDGIENISDIGNETWKVGAMGAALCSKSAAIESTRKRRRDRIEYEEQLARVARDNETEYTPWDPPESNTEFAQRTASECESNKEHWCSEMQLAAAEIMDADAQAEALTVVEQACASE